MNKWNELSVIARIVVISIVPVLWGVWAWMFATFETAESAELKWKNHNQAIACRTVYELKNKNESRQAQLQFDRTLSAEDKEFIKKQIDETKKDIQRIDPNGEC